MNGRFFKCQRYVDGKCRVSEARSVLAHTPHTYVYLKRHISSYILARTVLVVDIFWSSDGKHISTMSW